MRARPQMPAPGLGGLSEFLQEAALLSGDSDTEEARARGGVRLVTMHAAKGLEFQVVFVAGAPPGPPRRRLPAAPLRWSLAEVAALNMRPPAWDAPLTGYAPDVRGSASYVPAVSHPARKHSNRCRTT